MSKSPSHFGGFVQPLEAHRQRRSIACALVALWAAFIPAAAHAQPSPPQGAPEQVELRYAAGAGCPNQAAFVNEIGARIRRPIEWVAVNPSTLMVVMLQQTDQHASGKLEVTRHATPPTRREFIASTCAEVGSALALVAALTLDPSARTDALPLTGAASNDAAAPTAEAAPPAEVAPPIAPLPAPPPAAAPRPAPPLARPSEPVSASATSYGAWLGPVVGLSGGYAPTALVTVGLSLGARMRTAGGWQPSLQLTPLWGKTGTTGPAAPEASFNWAMARLEACPTRFRVTASLGLDGCVAGELGRLSARGSASSIVPDPVKRWWLAAGATASLHFRRGSWFARLGAHALFPTIRDEFVFQDPDQSIHQASVLVYGANLGLGFEYGR